MDMHVSTQYSFSREATFPPFCSVLRRLALSYRRAHNPNLTSHFPRLRLGINMTFSVALVWWTVRATWDTGGEPTYAGSSEKPGTGSWWHRFYSCIPLSPTQPGKSVSSASLCWAAHSWSCHYCLFQPCAVFCLTVLTGNVGLRIVPSSEDWVKITSSTTYKVLRPMPGPWKALKKSLLKVHRFYNIPLPPKQMLSDVLLLASLGPNQYSPVLSWCRVAATVTPSWTVSTPRNEFRHAKLLEKCGGEKCSVNANVCHLGYCPSHQRKKQFQKTHLHKNAMKQVTLFMHSSKLFL